MNTKTNAFIRLFIVSLYVIILVTLSGCNNSIGTNSKNNSYDPTSTETDIPKTDNESTHDGTDQNNPLESALSYDNIIEKINILSKNEDFILYSDASSIKRVTFELLSWETPNAVAKLDINNDANDEYIEIGLDNPNGTKILVEAHGTMNNLLYITSGFGKEFFSDYGDLALETRIELSFIDINNDNISECFLAIRKDNHVEIKVLQQINEADSLYSFIEIGSITSNNYAWLDADMKLWSLEFEDNLAPSYVYKPDTGLFENSTQDSKCFMSKNLVNIYGGDNTNDIYEYRTNSISGPEELVKLIESNTWSNENDTLEKLFFKNGSIFIGDTGSWFEYQFDSTYIDLDKLLVTYHVFQSLAESDTQAPSTINNMDYFIQLELSNITNSLELLRYDKDPGDAQIQLTKFLLEQ